MGITFGNFTFASPDLVLSGMDAPSSAFLPYRFLDGGADVAIGHVGGQVFSLSAILSTTGDRPALEGLFRWSDRVAMAAMPDSPQPFNHPYMDALGIDQVTAVFDKTSLSGLVQYNFDVLAHVGPSETATYPGTDDLLLYYGVLNFIRIS